MCKDGDACHRKICFFAHSKAELRPCDLPLDKSEARRLGGAATPDDAPASSAEARPSPGVGAQGIGLAATSVDGSTAAHPLRRSLALSDVGRHGAPPGCGSGAGGSTSPPPHPLRARAVSGPGTAWGACGAAHDPWPIDTSLLLSLHTSAAAPRAALLPPPPLAAAAADSGGTLMVHARIAAAGGRGGAWSPPLLEQQPPPSPPAGPGCYLEGLARDLAALQLANAQQLQQLPLHLQHSVLAAHAAVLQQQQGQGQQGQQGKHQLAAEAAAAAAAPGAPVVAAWLQPRQQLQACRQLQSSPSPQHPVPGGTASHMRMPGFLPNYTNACFY